MAPRVIWLPRSKSVAFANRSACRQAPFILFTLDGFRYVQVTASGRGSYFDLMRQAFMQKAAALGYETVDLETWFLPYNQRTGEPFEFPNDGHWNDHGHAVAADAVAASKLLKRLMH